MFVAGIFILYCKYHYFISQVSLIVNSDTYVWGLFYKLFAVSDYEALVVLSYRLTSEIECFSILVYVNGYRSDTCWGCDIESNSHSNLLDKLHTNATRY